MSEVRGSGREWQAVMVQEWLRGATLRPRSGATVWRSHPAYEARVGDGMSHSVPKARGSGREDNPRPRTGGCAGTGGARGAIPC